MRIVDVSRFQAERPDPLDLAKAQAAGITAVNIALDRGRSQDVLSPWARGYADRARELGMGVGSYRWLDARQSGAEHARRAIERIQALGGPDGMAHAVDCEDNADLATLTAYVQAMQDWLQRPVAIYPGRWWLRPRGWNVADLSPFLWAAPSVGYLPTYPGDESPHWTVDYGGHTELALMQHSVAPLPGTGECSLTAVRDPAVWAALTGSPNPEGGTMPTAAYTNWVRAGRPWKVAAPIKAIGDRLKAYGYTIYYLGSDDASHLQARTPQDHCPFSVTGWPVAHPYPYVTAMDIMPPKAGSGLPSLQQLGAQLVADKLGGVAGIGCLKYMNWEPDRDNGGRCWQDSFKPAHSRTTSTDRGHIHFSGRSDMVADAGAAAFYDPVARVRGQAPTQGDTVTPQDAMLFWTWDLQDGPNVEHAYKVLLRAADGVTALKADVDALMAKPAAEVTMTAANVDAIVTGVADKLAGNTAFLGAVAKAVADENARRQQA